VIRMDVTALDNPFWNALDPLHAGVAVRAGSAARYPEDVAPFLGLATHDAATPEALSALMAPGEAWLVLGVMPDPLPAGWQLEPFPELLQMVREELLPDEDDAGIVPLGADRRDDVLALTALVYPHYFRPGTTELGRYFGIDEDARLVAMIGERLGMPGWREMSAICTHPDATGRGLARKLTTMLTNDTLRRGDTPFLHVSPSNTRAAELYLRMGYRLRRTLPFAVLRRAAP